MSKKVVVIGSGFGGLGTACLFAKSGYDVTVLEKNSRLGGRANVFEHDGFRFDMGPSWYLAPDIFEHFFRLVGESIEDHLTLTRLSPSYRIFFANGGGSLDVQSNIERDTASFDAIEANAGNNLKAYLEKAERSYDFATRNFLYGNHDTIFDFINKRFAVEGRDLVPLASMHRFVSRYFSSNKLRQVMEYPMVFLGTTPYKAPALYNLLSHMDFNQGVFYPQGGFYELIKAIVNIARKNGVEFRTDTAVERIIVKDGVARAVQLADGTKIDADIVISNADMWFTETNMLEPQFQSYPNKYWQKRVIAPSAFIMYLGVREKLPGITHHNLFFSEDWRKNFDDIYKTRKLPSEPSLYLCAPSVTDHSVAPQGKENLFVLVPIAPGITISGEQKESYSDRILELIEKEMNLPGLREKIEYKRIYTVENFAADYNSFQGTALGLAHTLTQTAIFRPKNRSKKVKNLFYVGAGTNPGIGTQICLISAELVYKRVHGIKTVEPLSKLEKPFLDSDVPKDQKAAKSVEKREVAIDRKEAFR